MSEKVVSVLYFMDSYPIDFVGTHRNLNETAIVFDILILHVKQICNP